MIVRFSKPGKSFKGLAAYLTHDPGRAKTSERVAWCHTLNLANDDVPRAVDEMLWSYRAADQLKRQAGVGAGGRRLEHPVKHFSLNWHPTENPGREHMIESVEGFLAHMGWKDHQAVITCHTDKQPHVHVMLNTVHPETGRALDASFERRRAQGWALHYERAHEMIFCEERLKAANDRAPSPTRENWQRFKSSEIAFERAEVERLTKAPGYFERHDGKTMNGREWEALKAHQRKQREQFFIDGKAAFGAARKEAFREVRDEFRGQWNAYYAARRSGQDAASLAGMKAVILAAQRAALDERRKAACDHLRERRDLAYEAILEQQRRDKAELRQRQAQGLRTYQLFDTIYPAPEPERGGMENRDRSGAWRARGIDVAEQATTERMFERSRQAVIDPLGRGDDQARQPGILQRGSGTAAPVAECPGTQPAEMTEAATEKARIAQAREMTDQAREREQAIAAAALRASWNRHRRSRGGRD